jgi:hypothetical protein
MEIFIKKIKFKNAGINRFCQTLNLLFNYYLHTQNHSEFRKKIPPKISFRFYVSVVNC